MTRRANGEGTVYRRRDGRFEAAAYVPTSSGRRKRIRVYAATRAEAHNRLVTELDRAHRGLPVADRAWRLGDYLDYWLPIVKRTKRPTTYLAYESIVRLYLKPGLGARSLTQLTVSELQRYLDGQIEAGRSVRTVQKQRTVLSAALTRAQREELIVRNVAHHVELPQWLRKEIRPWTAEQLAAFLTAARFDPLYPVFVLLALYGLRRGEVLGLRWSDVDLGDGTLHIRQQLQRYGGNHHLGPAKTNAGRRDLPLLPLARAVLTALPDRPATGSDQLVFRTRFDNPIEGGNVLRSFERISRTHGLPRITLHHLRHTTATLLKNTGVPARDAQLILGHAHISTTQQLYQHGDMSGQREALHRLQGLLMGGDDRGGSRQSQPSTHVYWRLKDRNNFGGSSQTRTGDTRLFSSPDPRYRRQLTEVIMLAKARYRASLLGGAAVILSRQV